MTATTTIHASCVAVDGKGLLITGASGSGKSALALQLMAFGAHLIADDRVILSNVDGVNATAPQTIKNAIEARYIGILNATMSDAAKISYVVDLDQVETERLPPKRMITILGQNLPLFLKVEGLHFAPSLLQLLRSGAMSI